MSTAKNKSIKKFYGLSNQSLMYNVVVNPKGLVKSIKFFGPDGEELINKQFDTKKDPLKFSQLKKEKAFEYVLFLIYYPAVVEEQLLNTPSSAILNMLGHLKIKNPIIIKKVLDLRYERDKNYGVSREKLKWYKTSLQTFQDQINSDGI